MTFTPPTEDELGAVGALIDGAAASAKDVYEVTTKMGVTEDERNGLVGLVTMPFQYGTNRDPQGNFSYFTKMFGYADEL